MKRLFFFAILLFALPIKAFSQSFSSQNDAVNELMEKHIALGKARNAMPGYRVQIFFGDNREEANAIKSDFLRIHPNMGAYMVYQQPNFKIRVGDFKTRMSAMELLSEVQTRFPMAFIVKDFVKLPR